MLGGTDEAFAVDRAAEPTPIAPVLIVGAGPVGLTLAAELARYGVAVRIIDRSARPTETSKALVVWSRTLELMDRMGCAEAFLDVGLRAHGAAIRNGRSVLGQATFDEVKSPYNFALMIPQRDTERLLAEHLAAFGVSVEREAELTDFTPGVEGVKATLRHVDRREETVATPWLVGCDGAHSAIRHGLGLEFRGSAQADDWILADVRLDGPAQPARDEISPYLHHEGPFAVFPIPGGRARIVATVGRTTPGPRPDPTLADIQGLIDRRAGGGFTASDPVWLANFRINERKVADYRSGRVFLAGDAAHVHSPAGGQGMNTGMQDAINLAWKLAMVSRGEAAPSLLESYSPERSAVGDMVLRNASLLTNMAALTGRAAQSARDAVLHFLLGLHVVRARLATTMSETDIAYPSGPLSVGRRAGRRLDPAHYGGPPPGSGRAPRWVLYAGDAQRGRTLAARFPNLLEAAPRAPADGRDLLIVRPDAYVGLAVGGTGWDEAEGYLARLSGGGL
jgi:2-polyprenyl-6-methoxyphenol hydroxylase-like FAD-dependent oxidoreductase